MQKSQGFISKNLLIVGSFVLTGILIGVLLTAKMDWTPAIVAQDAAPGVNMNYNAASAPLMGANGESPFVAVAERVSPTVVNIESDRKVSRGGGIEEFFDNSPFWFFHQNPQDEDRSPRKQREQLVPSSGSGMFISRDGYILTNNHVVEDAEKVTVKLQDGHEYPAEIIGRDPDTDVAVIKINHNVESQNVALIGNSDEIKIGDWAVAVGNPLGLDWTLTVGVISARGRSNLAIQGGGPNYQDFIQTDASINFGNSGGPLCNIHGEVIGINTAINPSGQGIGFAIPINMAMKVVEQLRNNGQVSRGYLGMVPQELTAAFKSALDIPDSQEGVYVGRVDTGTPAADGGLREADVITEFNGVKVKDPKSFRMAVADLKPGSVCDAKIIRDGYTKTLSFTLGDRAKLASFAGRGKTPEPAEESWLGLEVTTLSENMARSMDLEATNGVIVTDVDPKGPCSGKIQERDIIIEIDRKEVGNVSDFKRIAAENKDRKKAILIRFIRGGQKIYEAIEPSNG